MRAFPLQRRWYINIYHISRCHPEVHTFRLFMWRRRSSVKFVINFLGTNTANFCTHDGVLLFSVYALCVIFIMLFVHFGEHASWMSAAMCWLGWVCNTFNSIIWRIIWTSNAWNHWCMRVCAYVRMQRANKIIGIIWLAYSGDWVEFCWVTVLSTQTHTHIWHVITYDFGLISSLMRYENDKTWHRPYARSIARCI